jgi:hypothetical protein
LTVEIFAHGETNKLAQIVFELIVPTNLPEFLFHAINIATPKWFASPNLAAR